MPDNHDTSDFDQTLAALDPEQWHSIGPMFELVTNRLITSIASLETMIADWSRARAYVSDAEVAVYEAYAADTDNKVARTRYQKFIETIQPNVEKARDAFNTRVLEQNERYQLPERYHWMIYMMKQDRSIFRAENPPLQAQADKLSTEYENLMTGLDIRLGGEPAAAVQVNDALAAAGRDEREQLWHMVWDQRLARADQVDQIYDRQIALRGSIAANAGFANFRDYAFPWRRRYAYTPEHAKAFQAAIESFIVPVARKFYQKHAAQLGVSTLKPWDISVTRFHEVMVTPYLEGKMPRISNTEIVSAAATILERIHPEMIGGFQEMIARGEVDFEARPGKASGAHMNSYPFKKRPYLFGNNSGGVNDVYTTLHEWGHCYHYLLHRDERIDHYRDLPMEAAEFASISTELMGQSHLDAVFSPEQCSTISRHRYQSIVYFLCYVGQVDAFQHWVYEKPDHSAAERKAMWGQLTDRFGPKIDWSGIEEFKGIYWQQQHHLFGLPFYYIEYGIAELAALQFEMLYRKNKKSAFSNWQEALALGASKPLPEIYAQAGIKFDFSEQTVRPLVEHLEREVGV